MSSLSPEVVTERWDSLGFRVGGTSSLSSSVAITRGVDVTGGIRAKEQYVVSAATLCGDRKSCEAFKNFGET